MKWLIVWLVDWLIDWLIDWLNVWLIDSLFDQVVDLEAERSRLQLQLKHVRGEKDSSETTRLRDLDHETKDALKQRVVELENQLGNYQLSWPAS